MAKYRFNVRDFTNRAYETYFGMKLGDQDKLSISSQRRKCSLSWNTRRYCISTLVKYKPPSKIIQFVMEYTMLLHIDPSQVQAPIQHNALILWNTRRYCIFILVKHKLPFKTMQFIMVYTTLSHIGPSQV